MNMREYLVRDRGYSPSPADMVMLTDAPENRGTPYEPTGQNMMAAFQWLVTGNNAGDSVFLSYSGHAGQVRDPDGDRGSGYDDTICPLDFESHGQITSDTLHKVIISPMNPRTRHRPLRLLPLRLRCRTSLRLPPGLPWQRKPNRHR